MGSDEEERRKRGREKREGKENWWEGGREKRE